MKVIVSIVSFNTRQLLRQCIENLLSQKTSHQVEVWVVDNASEDGSAQMIKQDFPKVTLIENKENIGFGKAHNQVFSKAMGDFFLIVNSDTKSPKDAIEKMVDFMQKYPDCGISSCKLVGLDGKLQSNGGDLPFGLALLSWLFNLEVFGNLPNFHRIEKEYYYRAREVGWVGGTYTLISSHVLKKAGLFDEAFFMYFEDTEICFRAKRAGFKIMINPKIVVEHVSGASSKDPRFRQWSGEFKGLLIFYKKQYGNLGALLIRMLIYFSTLLRVLTFALLGKLGVAKTYSRVLLSI